MSPGQLMVFAVAMLGPAWHLTREKQSDRHYVLGAALAGLALCAAMLGWLIELSYV